MRPVEGSRGPAEAEKGRSGARNTKCAFRGYYIRDGNVTRRDYTCVVRYGAGTGRVCVCDVGHLERQRTAASIAGSETEKRVWERYATDIHKARWMMRVAGAAGKHDSRDRWGGFVHGKQK